MLLEREWGRGVIVTVENVDSWLPKMGASKLILGTVLLNQKGLYSVRRSYLYMS